MTAEQKAKLAEVAWIDPERIVEPVLYGNSRPGTEPRRLHQSGPRLLGSID